MGNANSHISAQYTPQRVARFRDNPLIEALQPSPTEERLFELLIHRPDFAPEQRDWSTNERVCQVMGLSDFSFPLARHIQLAWTLDGMIRQGYVGREPRTAEHAKRLQAIYEAQKAGQSFINVPRTTRMAAFSTSLVGVSGMGKTRVLQRLQALYPPVIYHPKHQVWQIPFLHIETPHDGATVTGLCQAIFRKVDQLIPDADYYTRYSNRRSSVEGLLNDVARVLHIHCVGTIVLDEIQNLEQAPKNKQSLMSLLVSASNELGVPIVFVGTNKARRVLSLDFRQARRSVGHGGLNYWDRLKRGAADEISEADAFLQELWQYQWVRKPVGLTDQLADLMYHHTQGVIDLTIKLFAACQFRAMLDGTETITAQLIDDVAKTEMAMIEPMVDALRRNDLKALQAYDDIAPIDLEKMLVSAQAKAASRSLTGASTHPGDELFTAAVSGALEALGVGSEMADALATQVENDGTATNALEGTQQAIKAMMPPKAVRRGKKQSPPPKPLAPSDLRNASRVAEAGQATALEHLTRTGTVCDLRKVLNLR